ncbi:MAG: hypothetical protein EHM23_18225 [Acidobacteria bacterium]|nr:MAG: hypothetical protein EHM23_18225 [Acidobacteriota bacterium]
MSSENRWITLDYLELYCEQNRMVIGCQDGDHQLWISPLGPHPSSLTSGEVHQILTESALFELRVMSDDTEETETPSFFLTRSELEQRIQRMMN